MSDLADLTNQFQAGRPCLLIQTFEEADALSLVRRLAVDRRCDLMVWSAGTGIVDGLISDGLTLEDTVNPAAALYYFRRQEGGQIAVMLDLIGHLGDPVVLRQLRDTIDPDFPDRFTQLVEP